MGQIPAAQPAAAAPVVEGHALKVMRRKETMMKAGSKVRFHYCYFCDIHLTQGVTDGTSTPFQKCYHKIRANRLFFAARNWRANLTWSQPAGMISAV